MKPPYEITPEILALVASISEKLGEVKSAYLQKAPTELRRGNRIRTIQSSLKIEGNTLTADQITALLDNKRVIAPEKDIFEVQNAIAAYELLNEYNPFSITSLCKCHKILMNRLEPKAGRIRSSAVGIVRGSQIEHIAPPGDRVRPLLIELLEYLKKDKDLMLIKSCVFHYEFEFIHPFIDGNGRLGRLWQTVILKHYNPVFEFLPVEAMIRKRQTEYYSVLGKSDKIGNSTPFIEFMLSIIEESLEDLLKTKNINLTGNERVEVFRAMAGSDPFSRADYLRYFKDISTATASRDLKQASNYGILEKSGNGIVTRYIYK